MKFYSPLIPLPVSGMAHVRSSGVDALITGTTTYTNNTFHAASAAFGRVATTGAPASITITRSDENTSDYTRITYAIDINEMGIASFSYSTNDIEDAGYDYFVWGKNNVTSVSVAGSVSGTVNIAVTAGDTMVIGISATDNMAGALTAPLSDFSDPANIAQPVNGSDIHIVQSVSSNVLPNHGFNGPVSGTYV